MCIYCLIDQEGCSIFKLKKYFKDIKSKEEEIGGWK